MTFKSKGFMTAKSMMKQPVVTSKQNSKPPKNSSSKSTTSKAQSKPKSKPKSPTRRRPAMSKPHKTVIIPASDQTLRDHFAGLAMSGLLARNDTSSSMKDELSVLAYHFADAMLLEREKPPEPEVEPVVTPPVA